MVRPREFDEAEVLEKVLNLFWSKGFDATSIDDLVTSTGVGRASLYGTFGDKSAMFERAIGLYMERADRFAAGLATSGSARKAVEEILRGWVRHTCPKSGPKGCFLMLSGTTGEVSEVARKTLHRWLAQREALLAELIARGQASGEIRPALDPLMTGRMLMVFAQGIATSARAGWERARLDQVVDELIRDLL